MAGLWYTETLQALGIGFRFWGRVGVVDRAQRQSRVCGYVLRSG